MNLKSFLFRYLLGIDENSAAYILQQSGLFSSYSKLEMEQLAKAAEWVHFNSGTLIFRENEIGDCLYVIQEGSVRVFTQNEGQEVVLSRLEKYRYFGEQALLEETPGKRNASVIAITDVSLFKISHSQFQKILKKNQGLKSVLQRYGNEELFEKATKQNGVLSLLSHQPITENKKFATFQDGEKIFSKGDPPDKVYLILSGTVHIFLSDEKNPTTIMKPGEFFGEKGVIENKPRKGTAVAIGEVKLAEFDSEAFRTAYHTVPELNEYIGEIQNIYQLSQDQYVTLYHGKFLGFEAICAIFQLKKGRRVVSSRVIGKEIFTMSQANIPAGEKLIFNEGDTSREILLDQNKVVGFTSIGFWDEINEMCNRILRDKELDTASQKLFKATGRTTVKSDVAINDPLRTICSCMRISSATIIRTIQEGASDINKIEEKTGAGSVCGGCRQTINQFLGRGHWTMASIINVIRCNRTTHSFQIKPYGKSIQIYNPGQYLFIQALVNRDWIERTYTLTSVSKIHGYYEITIQQEPKGFLSHWIFEHEGNDPLIRVSDPLGNFIFSPEKKEPAVCFVAGIGMTPALSFARSNFQGKRRLYIDYSARGIDRFIYSNELQNLSEQFANVSIYLRDTTKAGRITAGTIEEIAKKNPTAEYFICGPKSYMEMVVKVLHQISVNSDRIHIEDFVPAGGPIKEQDNARQ